MGDKSLLISFGPYLVVLVGVGILCYRLSSSLSDFILAGRRLGAWAAAISAQAAAFDVPLRDERSNLIPLSEHELVRNILESNE